MRTRARYSRTVLLEPAGQQRLGQPADLPGTGNSRSRGGEADSPPTATPDRAEPAELVDDQVQALPGDELHRVVADVPFLAHLEDGDDVGVVQPGRGAGLAAEPLQRLVVLQGVARAGPSAPRGGRGRPARPRRRPPCRRGRPRGGCDSRPACGESPIAPPSEPWSRYRSHGPRPSRGPRS